jgi:hypothetical protein
MQLTAMMEIQIMEMDAAVHVQSNLNGNAQEVPHLSLTHVMIYEVMALLFKLYQITATMEVLEMVMDVVLHVQLKLIGNELVAAQHHLVYAMTFVETVKK